MGTIALADVRSKFERLKSLFEADPDNAALRRDCIGLARQLKEFDFMLGTSDRVLASIPTDPVARFDRAGALIGKGDYLKAVDELRGLRAEFSELTAPARDLGLCYYCIGDYSRARPELEAAYAGADRSPDLIRLLVSTLHHLAAVDEAIEIASRNQDVAVADGALAGVYALLYLDAGISDQAARWAEMALKQNPDSVDGLVVRGTLAAERMDNAIAEQCFKRALEIAPASGRAWLGLGAFALLQKNLNRARMLFSRALEYMPRHVGTWHVLAWTHILAGSIEAAEEAFHRSAELDRNFAETHGGLAATAALRGDRAVAKRLIEVARKLDPACLSAQFAESVLIGQAGDVNRARQTLLSAAAGLANTQNSALARLLKRAGEKQN